MTGWLNTVTVENVHPNTTVAMRMNGISGAPGDFGLYAYGADGTLQEVSEELWHIQAEDGTVPENLDADTLYEVHMTVEDSGAFDLASEEKEITVSFFPVSGFIICSIFASKKPVRSLFTSLRNPSDGKIG